MVRSLFFILVIAHLALAGCGDKADRQASQPPDDVNQKFSQFSLMQSRGGRVKWRLEADAATYLKPDRAEIENVELVIFGDKDGEMLTIRGDRGMVNERTNDVRITGNVSGVYSDGGRFTADEVCWREKIGRIYTPPGVKVTIVYEDSVIVGEQLIADPKLETAKLKNITGVTRPKEEKGERSTG